jgi:hypothetical protein
MRNTLEDKYQKAVIEWGYSAWQLWPWCAMWVERRVRQGRGKVVPLIVRTVPIIAYPGGGNRSAATGRILHETGTRKGTPDLEIPVACGGFYGFRIEMKTETGTVTTEQKRMLKWFDDNNWKTAICRGSANAISEITEYLNSKKGV